MQRLPRVMRRDKAARGYAEAAGAMRRDQAAGAMRRNEIDRGYAEAAEGYAERLGCGGYAEITLPGPNLPSPARPISQASLAGEPARPARASQARWAGQPKELARPAS